MAAFRDCWAFGIVCAVKDLGSKSETPFSSTDPVQDRGQGFGAQCGVSYLSHIQYRKKADKNTLDEAMPIKKAVSFHELQ